MADARRHAGGDPAGIGLADFLRDAALELADLYKSSGWTWSRLRREAGLPSIQRAAMRIACPGLFLGCFISMILSVSRCTSEPSSVS